MEFKVSPVKHIFILTYRVAIVFSKFHPCKLMAFISFLYWYKQQQLWIFPLLSSNYFYPVQHTVLIVDQDGGGNKKKNAGRIYDLI